ncbi:MAG: cysteine desulfurase family protein [Pseudomonadota bacterium]
MGIYCDFNATRPMHQEVKEAMWAVLDTVGNPSSVHTHGRNMRDLIERARRDIADMLKITIDRLIFCSGATEANNLVLLSFDGPVIVSAIEHTSVLQVRNDAQLCPVTSDGIVCLDALERLLKSCTKKALVCIMAANNETGVVQPIDDIAALVHLYGGFFHCDAVQAVGRMPVCWRAIDSFAISAHKLGGPFGVGILGLNATMPLQSPFKGGGQERSFRPGTENVWGIVGMAKAMELALKEDWGKTITQIYWLEHYITAICPEAVIIGKNAPRLPNTSMISMPNMDSTKQLIQFDLNRISISNGSACSSGKVSKSAVLQAMSIPPEIARGCIRISLGATMPEQDVQQLANTWYKIHTRNNEQKKQENAKNIFGLSVDNAV